MKEITFGNVYYSANSSRHFVFSTLRQFIRILRNFCGLLLLLLLLLEVCKMSALRIESCRICVRLARKPAINGGKRNRSITTRDPGILYSFIYFSPFIWADPSFIALFRSPYETSRTRLFTIATNWIAK